MGHFSYTCHLSGLPITGGTPCVLLPILPRQNTYDNELTSLRRYGKGSLVSNDGPNLYFKEMCFPIFGTYNDYGGLEKIVKDDNTFALEKFFNMKINDIVNCILDNRKDQFKVDQTGEDDVKDQFNLSYSKSKLKLDKYPNRIFLVRASATWYRKDVYEKLVKANSENRDYFDRIDLGVFGLLKKLGFKKGKELVKGRFNTPFTKKDLTIYSDGNWIAEKPGDMANCPAYDLPKFREWCAKKGVKINSEELENMSMEGQIYHCILPSLKKLEFNDRWNSERVIRMLLGGDSLLSHATSILRDDKLTLKLIEKRTLEKEKNPEAYAEQVKEMGFDPIEFLKSRLEDERKRGPINELPLLYLKLIKEKDNNFLLKNIEDWFAFKSYYYPTGRFLYPVGTSDQDGNHEKVYEMLQIASECLKAEVEERRANREEDELELEEA